MKTKLYKSELNFILLLCNITVAVLSFILTIMFFIMQEYTAATIALGIMLWYLKE
jgi:hypothetical protein